MCTELEQETLHRGDGDGNKDITPKELFQVIHNIK